MMRFSLEKGREAAADIEERFTAVRQARNLVEIAAELLHAPAGSAPGVEPIMACLKEIVEALDTQLEAGRDILGWIALETEKEG
ncbi:hypothetical protein [Flexivirga meconopsidis]|uniref:hypothetical protein n=1 Tax=Flexivirga meconopsidis TaxID=2977121 RepID=UPI00223EF44D|nr:hypothetical protein [Flexivirga meconopsidis]